MARWVAMYLNQEVCGGTLPNIAKEFNAGHYSTVSQTIRRLKVQMVDDKKLRRRFNMLSQDLTPYFFIRGFSTARRDFYI